MQIHPSHRRLALPLGLQLLGILVGSLIVAQLVTMVLTVAIPPAPAQRWNLDEVAAQLAGGQESNRLERRRMAGPPDITGAGWLVSESSRQALATKLGRAEGDVVLAFYTQLPVGGVTVPVDRRRVALADGAPQAGLSWLVGTAQAQGVPGGPPPGGMPGGGFPGGGFPGGGFPGGGMPGGGAPGGRMPGGVSQPGGGPVARAPAPPVATSGQSGQPGQAPGGQPGGSPNTAGPLAQTGSPNAAPAAGGAAAAGPPGGAQPPVNSTPPIVSPPTVLQPAAPRPAPEPIARPTFSAPVPPQAAPMESPAGREQGVAPAPAASQGAPTNALPGPAPREAAAAVAPAGTPQPIPFREAQGLLSFTSPPFIEGDFIAAVRQPDGSWLAVAPTAEPFPNRWQQRVMLWSALSLRIAAPRAWLFARRIVKPLERFAQTADLLGRDPAANVLPLSGPAEIGRAARAFNIMQTRLRAFVDDRTAMIGAISHDLRTPLTRLRFRLEDVPDEQRDGLLREVEEMEEMISQVIGFIRDASTPGARQRLDFAELVESSVEDAQVLGGRVEIEAVEHALVEVDPLGMRRLLGNLLENALKYGGNARVRVSMRDEQAIAEIIDDGPGIPAEERDQAFDPFYRGVQAHGGDVNLEQRSEGFVASAAVPLSFDSRLPKAA